MKEIDFSDIAIIKGRGIFYSCPVCGAQNVRRDDPYCTHCNEMFRRDVEQKGYPDGYDEHTYSMTIWQKRRVIHRDYKLGKYDKAQRDRRMQQLLKYAIEVAEERRKASLKELARRKKQKKIYEDLD